MEQCKNCRYFIQLDKKSICRRYPPQPYGKYSFSYPYVYPDNWCGEFKETDGGQSGTKRTSRKTTRTNKQSGVETDGIPTDTTTNGRRTKTASETKSKGARDTKSTNTPTKKGRGRPKTASK